MATPPANAPSQMGSETLQVSPQPGTAKPMDKTGGPADATRKELRQIPGTKVFTLKDIPQRPQMVLKLTLPQKSYWERFVDTVRSLPPREFLAAVQGPKKKKFWLR